jgi:hypothetical protein
MSKSAEPRFKLRSEGFKTSLCESVMGEYSTVSSIYGN